MEVRVRVLEAETPGRGIVLLRLAVEHLDSAAAHGRLEHALAAFGADAMVLGENSCDPFWRQSIRVSMGTVFSLPLVRSQDLLKDLDRLRREWGVDLVAIQQMLGHWHVGTTMRYVTPSATFIEDAYRKAVSGALSGLGGEQGER